MKIAIYADTFPPNAGGISAAHEQLARLLEKNHEVCRFAFNDSRPNAPAGVHRATGASWQGRCLEWGIRTFIRRYDRSGYLSYCPAIARTIPAIRRLNRHLARFEPEVLILGDNYLPSLAVKKPARTTVIWVAHHNYARFRNQPLTEGPCDYDCFLAHRLERRALRKADYAVFASLYMETVFRSTLGAAPPGRVVPNAFVLPNGLTDRREQIRSELGLKGSDILIYLPSGGSSIKGRRYVPALIQRLSRVNPAPTFYVSGHISDDFRWESAQMAPGARIIADGFVSSATNIERVSACDIAVSPALMENYSCALLEAQAMGVPCVTFDVGGNREVVADGLSGFVVSFLDLDTLAMKAAELMAAPLLRSRMSDTARTHAATIADPARLLAAWNGVLSGAHTRQGAI